MPANVDRENPLTIGEREAVEILFSKVRGGRLLDSEEMRSQMLKARRKALEMYDGSDDERFTEPEQKAFYHGLLTGYAVALCMMDQQAGELEV